MDSQQTMRKEKNSVDDNIHNMQILKAMRLQQKSSAEVNNTDKSQLILTVGPKPLDATLKINQKNSLYLSENMIKADAHSIT